MRHYINVYKVLIRQNFAELAAYRAHFISMVLSSLIWGSFHFISILLLTNRSSTIFGWSRHEVILLTASYSIMWGVFHLLFAKNFNRMSRLMDLGQLDSLLTKPIDSQFLVSCTLINFTGLFRTVLGTAAAYYIIKTYQIPVSFVNIIGFVVLLMFGLILIYSIWFIVLTLTIWFANLTNLLDLLFHISGIGRYPANMLRNAGTFVFIFLLPLMLMVATPTKSLLNKVLAGDIIGLILISILLFYTSRRFWHFALRHYTSASG